MNKSRFYVKIISLILIAIISVTFIMVIIKPSESAMAETTANNNNEQRSVTSLDSLQAETGISYIDVFQEYYLQVSDRLASGGI